MYLDKDKNTEFKAMLNHSSLVNLLWRSTLILTASGLAVVFGNSAFAQIQPDNSLGEQNSIVNDIDALNKRIDGGVKLDANLFHSFQEFNVSEGGSVYFANPQGITDIFSRVTGNNPSNIFGKLGVLGDANLFLINPNGIVFGENASLDLQGSFVASTANGVEFGELGVFSASNPETPRLLNVSPSALFFNAVNNQAGIQNNSIASAGTDPAGFNVSGLRVADGKSLLLVGGNVSIDGGELNAYGGRVELGGLAAPGSINLLVDGDNLKLGFPENVTRADVSLTNQAFVFVEADGGGDIAINARNLDILQGSKLFAGIGRGLGTADTVAGDITLNATDNITIANPISEVYNNVNPGAIGNGGDINIKAKQLNISEGGQITALTFGEGDTGNINVNAFESVELNAGDTDSLTGLFVQVGQQGIGNGGDVLVETKDLEIKNGAQISAITFGEGNAGNLNIRVNDFFEISGNEAFPSGLFIEIASDGIGSSGDLTVETGSLSITDGGRISASTFGKGNAGSINIFSRDTVSIKDSDRNNSLIFNNIGSEAVGDTSGINITTGSLFVTDGAQIESFGYGEGNSGKITINARDNITLDNNAAIKVEGDRASDIRIEGNKVNFSGASKVESATRNQDGGEISIRAETLEIAGNSGIFSNTLSTGKSGDIIINVNSFIAENSLIAATSLFALGETGNITLKAQNLINLISSFISTSSFGTSSGGSISVETKDLNIENGAGMITSVADPGNPTVNQIFNDFFPDANGTINLENLKRGNSGNLTIVASNSVKMSGESANGTRSGLITGTVGAGDGGNLTINTRELIVTDGGTISTGTAVGSQGKGGDLTIIAADSIELIGTNADVSFASGLDSSTKGNGDAGSLKVETEKLIVQDGAQIFAGTFPSSQGNGGDLTVIATDSIELNGTNTNGSFTSGLRSSTGGGGDAGDLKINTSKLIIQDGAEISAANFNQGNAGKIEITANSLFLTNNAEICNETGGRGNAGNTNINADDIQLSNNSLINSDIKLGANGEGGDINIVTNSLQLKDGSQLLARTEGVGNAGDINVTADSVIIDGFASSDEGNDIFPSGIFTSIGTNGQGDGGDINITTKILNLSNDSELQTIVRKASNQLPIENRNAGDITINADNFSAKDDADILSYTRGKGNAGNIIINTNNLQLSNEAGISAYTDGQGNAGDVTINASNIEFTGNSLINNGVNNEGVGNGGEINVKTDSLLLIGGSQINSFIFGQKRDNQGKVIYPGGNGNAGNVNITADTVGISGMDENGFSSAILTISERGSSGFAGDISIKADNLQITDGAVISATTFNDSDSGDIFINTKNFEALNGGQVVSATRSSGNAGKINFINATGNIKISGSDANFQQELDRAREYIKNNPSTRFEEFREIVINEGANSGIFANTASNSTGDGGVINLQANSLSINNSAQITAQSLGSAAAGNININLGSTLQAENSNIQTTSEESSGGAINITAKDIRLFGDSDIATNVFSGEGGGGDITLNANTIIALDDSDILSFAGDGKGGDITFNTEAFFSKPLFKPTSSISDRQALNQLNTNQKVDVNASGAVSGTITGVPDTTFIQDSLTELPENQIDTNTIIANSCIVRSNEENGTFLITGAGGLPINPSDAPLSNYSTGSVRSIPTDSEKLPALSTRRPWKIGDPVVEPQGVYQLPNGQLVLSRECG
ncbi:MAG: filamentous hemagglutinin N-terminal domain-containing protein [Rivularia sp. (in: cyanobacteria)]